VDTLKRVLPTAGSPIGVFDSGVGGLTVHRALRRALPKEKLLYLGDTARVPYGNKSKATVTRYSLEIGRFLESKGIKLLVVACNSASALALPALKRGLSVPVVGVIGPAVRAARSASRSGRIGVIGTEATLKSGAYQKALAHGSEPVRVRAAACPLFVPLVEEGWWEGAVPEGAARKYLGPMKSAGIDSLILGCTHYPLLKPLLKKVLGPRVNLIDCGTETARETASVLTEHGLARRSGKGSETFYVTDAAERFSRSARRFLRRQVLSARVVRFGA